ncbi:hypothetical protein ACQEU6_31940 [Spirillospora sp. CA-108201]
MTAATDPAAISPEAIKAALQAEFPGWRVMRTDQLRWWALCGPLPADRYHEQDVVEADTPEALRRELRRLKQAKS